MFFSKLKPEKMDGEKKSFTSQCMSAWGYTVWNCPNNFVQRWCSRIALN